MHKIVNGEIAINIPAHVQKQRRVTHQYHPKRFKQHLQMQFLHQNDQRMEHITSEHNRTIQYELLQGHIVCML